MQKQGFGIYTNTVSVQKFTFSIHHFPLLIFPTMLQTMIKDKTRTSAVPACRSFKSATNCCTLQKLRPTVFLIKKIQKDLAGNSFSKT